MDVTLRSNIIAGQRLAMQGSYERRAPARKAVPLLLDARGGLREYVRDHGEDATASIRNRGEWPVCDDTRRRERRMSGDVC